MTVTDCQHPDERVFFTYKADNEAGLFKPYCSRCRKPWPRERVVAYVEKWGIKKRIS